MKTLKSLALLSVLAVSFVPGSAAAEPLPSMSDAQMQPDTPTGPGSRNMTGRTEARSILDRFLSQQKQQQDSYQHTQDANAPDMRDQAFSKITGSLYPLNTREVKELRRLFNASQKASAFVEDVPPKPTSSSVVVDLSPGAVPPIIRPAAGYITSLVFLDGTGAPWPIKSYDLGNPSAFNIQWDKKGNTLLIQAITMYKRANLAVMLEGLNTPIMITFVPGQRAIDYRADMQVPRLGPNAFPSAQGLPDITDPALLTFLNGVPPQGSQTLRVNGGDARAWMFAGSMYLRTPMTVISPSWIAKMSGPDNVMQVYQLPQSNVVLALKNGAMKKLKLEGF